MPASMSRPRFPAGAFFVPAVRHPPTAPPAEESLPCPRLFCSLSLCLLCCSWSWSASWFWPGWRMSLIGTPAGEAPGPGHCRRHLLGRCRRRRGCGRGPCRPVTRAPTPAARSSLGCRSQVAAPLTTVVVRGVKGGSPRVLWLGRVRSSRPGSTGGRRAVAPGLVPCGPGTATRFRLSKNFDRRPTGDNKAAPVPCRPVRAWDDAAEPARRGAPLCWTTTTPP